MKNWILSSFARKFGFLALIIGAVISIAFASFHYNNNKNELNNILKQQAQQLSETLALLLNEDVRYQKQFQLWSQLNQIYINTNLKKDQKDVLFYIREIAVTDNNGRVLGHTNPAKNRLTEKYHYQYNKQLQSANQWFDSATNTFVTKVTIVYSGEQLGTLLIDFDISPLDIILADLFSDFLILLWIMIIAIVLMTISLTYFINTPLQNITSQLDNIGSGKVTFKTIDKNKDEFGKLARAIKDTDQQIYKDKIELEYHQQNLEKLVKERTSQLEAAQDELVKSERLAVLGQLTATVSHELRNPLGAIQPSLYLLRKKIINPDETLVRAMDRIDRNVRRCDHIIDELLDFTRIKELNLTRIDLNIWLGKLLDEQNINSDIDVNFDSQEVDLQIVADVDRLRRAVINTVENACQAMLEPYEPDNIIKGSCLTISTHSDAEKITINIADNGCGISTETLPHIFEPLFSTKGFGVGLGMPTIKQIMTQHGGDIDIETSENIGTRISLWLPKEISLEVTL